MVSRFTDLASLLFVIYGLSNLIPQAQRSRDSEGSWLSGKIFNCRPMDCEFDPPTQTEITKIEMYWFFSGQCSRVSKFDR